MIGLVRRNSEWLVVTCFATLMAAGCGSNGNVSADSQSQMPPPAPFITGVVFAPNGELAATDNWWRWAARLRLLPPAYAQECAFTRSVLPVDTTGVQVILSHVDQVDAADGQIDDPTFLAQDFVDPNSGVYSILSAAAANVNECGLIVSVGGGSVLTRGFVFQRTTNIDAVSEAIVRVILDRLTQAPAVQLCTFQSAGLQNIYNAAQQAACTVSGDNVFDLNEKVFAKVATDCCVRKAIDNATPAHLPTDPNCTRVNCPLS